MAIIIIFGALDWLILVFDFWKSNIRYPKWLHPTKLKDDFDSEWIVKNYFTNIDKIKLLLVAFPYYVKHTIFKTVLILLEISYLF